MSGKFELSSGEWGGGRGSWAPAAALVGVYGLKAPVSVHSCLSIDQKSTASWLET